LYNLPSLNNLVQKLKYQVENHSVKLAQKENSCSSKLLNNCNKKEEARKKLLKDLSVTRYSGGNNL
jgi:hypothetical protein